MTDNPRGRQGGHLAGTGLAKKTEFPPDRDGPKILDAGVTVRTTVFADNGESGG